MLDIAKIPEGWYRICKIPRRESEFAEEFNLFGGIVRVSNSHHSGPKPLDSTLPRWSATFQKDQTRKPKALTLCEKPPFLLAWFPETTTPNFDIVPLSPLIRDHWSAPFHLRWIVKSNLLEIAENAADMGHFTSVHIYKEHAQLSKFLTEDHKMSVFFKSARRILGIRVPVEIELHYQGLGWVESRAKSPMVEVHVVYTPTPIDSSHLEINLSLSFKKTRNPLFNLILRLILPWEAGRDYQRDIPIWENKIIHQHPKLCSADGPILKLRRWANRFYSPRIEGNSALQDRVCRLSEL